MSDELTKLNNGELDFIPLKFKNVKTNEVTNFTSEVAKVKLQTLPPFWKVLISGSLPKLPIRIALFKLLSKIPICFPIRRAFVFRWEPITKSGSL